MMPNDEWRWNMATSVLKGLKLVSIQKPRWSRDADPIQNRRDKLVGQLQEQAQLLANPDHQRTIHKRSGDVTKRVKPWWIVGANGSVVFQVKYGHGSLEFAKGLTGIEVQADKLPSLIETLVTGVRAGEFDSQMAKMSEEIRTKITKTKSQTRKAA
jgi:hypothetical protein